MDSVRFLLRLRLRAAHRMAAALVPAEPLSSLLALAALAAGGVYAYREVQTVRGAIGIAAVALGLVWIVHAQRNDQRFLRIAGVPYRLLHAAELLLLLLPVALLLLLSADPRLALLPALGAVLIAATPPSLMRRLRGRRRSRPPVRHPTVWGAVGLLVLAASLAVPPVAAFLLWRLWRQGVRNLEPYACG